MIRFAWLGVRLFILVVAAVWLSNHPGKVSIAWQHYLVETSVGALIAIVVVAVGLAILLNRLVRDILRLPQRWAKHREAQTDRRGRKALIGGLAAVASGDAISAHRLGRQSEATLVDPVLSHLLTAEALILSGENDAAESQFELLLGREDTRVIGHRGLIEVALARGDWARAYSRTRQARPVMPKSPWLLRLLIDLAARAGDLGEARQALDLAAKSRALPAPELKRRQVALWTALAFRAAETNDPKQALSHLQKALDEDPGFVPAAVLAARLHRADERLKSAERLLERAWSLGPHPDLVEAWRSLAPIGDPAGQALWMKRLGDAQPANPDAALAYAEAAIGARMWAEGRRVLEPMAAAGPYAARAALMLGRLEREEKGSLAAAALRYDQAEALLKPEPGWACHACGHETAAWSEICPHCGGFAHIQGLGLEKREAPAFPVNPVSLPGIGTALIPANAAPSLR